MAPYLIFAATWVAAALVPTVATGLLFSGSADLIAIAALLGSVRFFLALARMQLPVEGRLPSLAGAVDWLNSPPLTAEALRGHVVLVDFWTYSCINCLRTRPYVEAWAEKYRDQGLIVIGVHAPEFAFERNIDNVRAAVKRLGDRLSRCDRQQLRDLARLQQ